MQLNDQNDESHLLKKATEAIQQKDFQKAAIYSDRMNKLFPEIANGWHLTSFIAMQLNNLEYSLEAISKAITLMPFEYRLVLQKMSLLVNLGSIDKAVELGLETYRCEISDSIILEELALFLSKYQYIDKAKKLYEKALLLNPDSDRTHYNLATMQNFLGEIEEADKNCDRAVKLNRFNSNAHFLRSGLKKQTPDNNHIAELESLLKEHISNSTDFTQICFALAKEYEDCENFTQSFEVRKRGAELYRKNMEYDFQSDIRFINKIIETYSQSLLANSTRGFKNDEPIFVLGLPRSGSTLVDRIISSHSDVFSAGELTNFTHQMIAMMAEISDDSNPSREKMVTLSSQLNFQKLGQAYIDSTRATTGNTPKFIDKFPQNALYAGSLHLALPNSKIILIERHPLDVCYAMYKQLFTEIYQFSYDLDELADYFIAYQKLMEHWKRIMPEHIHVVCYEDLVNDIESVSRGILTFCNLEWQSQCLDFQDNEQATMTASASQVRQKIYTTSVGMWKNYQNQLDPLIKKITNAGLLKNWEM
jgi:tetratricopeptide (TPR) repeat protein